MALRTSAKNAEDVAAGFCAFRDHLPEHATEITGLMSNLYAVSSSLSSLDQLTNEPRYRRGTARAQPDLTLVRASLKHTLEDIVDFFYRVDGGDGGRDVFKQTWTDMLQFFWDESHDDLVTRCAKYKTLLREMGDVVKDKPHESNLLSRFRSDIKALLATQDERLEPQLRRMSLGRNPSSSGASAEPSSPASDRRPRPQRSYERPRPPHLSPQSPLSPSSGTFSDIPPSAPDAPLSPSTASTRTTTTTTSQSPNADAIRHHWAKSVFISSDTNTTPIPLARDHSDCLGQPRTGIRQWLQEQGYSRLVQLSFDDEYDLQVSFYLRERDHRARILCKKSHLNRPSEYACLPLDMLEINRLASCLQLCRRRRGGTELVLWANLRFTTIESMVLFFCTFLALRGQDLGRPVENIRDSELDDEMQYYGGQIIDDGYPHALRVYQDTISGAVRLQVSVQRGDMKRTPVWTAFVTHLLDTPGWIRRRDSTTVLLRRFEPAILMSAEDYTPPRTSRGEHILTFPMKSDADSFMNVMEEMATLAANYY